MTGANIAARLRGQYFRAMLKQDIAWFDLPENAVGGLITRLALDVSDVYKARHYFITCDIVITV